MRKPLIAGNWKMNKTISEALELVNSLKREFIDVEGIDIVVCPSYTALCEVADALLNSNIGLGAQDVHWKNSGAFTGEVSPLMLKDVGCSYVIIGHSERRKYFFETDETVNKKIKAALDAGLIPIFCLGETLQEREASETISVVKRQLQGGLKDLCLDSLQQLIIAYEPVWAIGTGVTATPSQAEEVHVFIRDCLKEYYSLEVAQNLRILYGGSVKPANIEKLMQQPNIDGALVGGASLEENSFIEIIKKSQYV